MAMQLTAEQQAMLDGKQGEVMAKVMKTLVMYGETFGAEKMVPVTSEKGHLVTSFGLKMMTPVFDLMDQLLNAGVTSKQKFSVDPKPFDPNVPSDFLKNFVFKKFMYSKQDSYNEQLRKMGLLNAGVTSKQKFSVDPKPFDPAVPSDFLKNFVFKKFMYSKQDS